jgi:hypothetical protein
MKLKGLLLFIFLLPILTSGVIKDTLDINLEKNSSIITSPKTIIGIENNYLLVILIALLFIIIFIFILKWILNTTNETIKLFFENLCEQIKSGFNNLEKNLLQALGNMNSSNCSSITQLSTNIYNILRHIAEIKQESGNFVMSNKESRILLNSIIELEAFKESQIIVEILNNKTINKIEEAINSCRIKFLKIIEDDINLLLKVDYINGNLGELLKLFLTDSNYINYINVVLREIFQIYWDENDFEKIRENSYSKLLIYKQEFLIKDHFNSEE